MAIDYSQFFNQSPWGSWAPKTWQDLLTPPPPGAPGLPSPFGGGSPTMGGSPLDPLGLFPQLSGPGFGGLPGFPTAAKPQPPASPSPQPAQPPGTPGLAGSALGGAQPGGAAGADPSGASSGGADPTQLLSLSSKLFGQGLGAAPAQPHINFPTPPGMGLLYQLAGMNGGR